MNWASMQLYCDLRFGEAMSAPDTIPHITPCHTPLPSNSRYMLDYVQLGSQTFGTSEYFLRNHHIQ